MKQNMAQPPTIPMLKQGTIVNYNSKPRPLISKNQILPPPAAVKKRPSHPESALQRLCIRWFRLQHSKYRLLLFSIPNGAVTSGFQRQILAVEGVVPGVADIFLSVACKSYHGMYIEMKVGKNDLSDYQKQFRDEVTAYGFKYIVCRSLDEFQLVINDYLK